MFIAGNSECECLSDIIETLKDSNNWKKHIFGKGKYQKTLTFEQMCLIYRYLQNCCEFIKIGYEDSKVHAKGFKKTIYLRHSIKKFTEFNNMLEQGTIKINELNDRNFILITGHIKIFACTGPIEYPEEEMYYFVDTSVVHGRDRRKNYLFPRAIRGQGTDDHRIAVIKFEKEKGFSVSVSPSSSNFYRWSCRYRFANIQ